MKNDIKLFTVLIFFIGLILACGNSNKSDSPKNKLDNEAQLEANKIFGQYYLIENGNWYTCKLDKVLDRSGKVINKSVDYYRQYKTVHTSIKTKELNNADLLNGVEWKGECIMSAISSRAANPDKINTKKINWNKWFDLSNNNVGFISLRKEKGAWIIESSGEAIYV